MLIDQIDSSLNRPVAASNEGGIKFHPNIYEKMPNVSGVSMEACRREGITGDIERVFRKVAEHDMKDHNLNAGSGKEIEIADMPGVGDKLQIRKLSEHILPTAVSLANGFIVINENFVKILYSIKKAGYDKAIMRSGTGHGNYGTFYDALIYSVALHEIRGHFMLKNGEILFNADETRAQGIRGNKYLIDNFMAASLFWLRFLENAGRDNKHEGLSAFFRDDNHFLLADMEPWDRGDVIENTRRAFTWELDGGVDFSPEYVPVRFEKKYLIDDEGRFRYSGPRFEKIRDEFFPVTDRPLSWQDIINVFDFLWLQEGRVPVRAGRIAMSIYPENIYTQKDIRALEKKVGRALQALISLKLVELAGAGSGKNERVSEMRYKLAPRVGPREAIDIIRKML